MPTDSDNANLSEIKQQAIEWLVRLRDEGISDEEMKRFADWMAGDYRHCEAFARAEELFDDMVIAAQISSDSDQTLMNQLDTTSSVVSLNRVCNSRGDGRYKEFVVSTKRWIPALLAIAAVWLFAVNLVLPENLYPLDRFLTDYGTVTGELRQIQLSDGSHILLNTDSAVSVNYDDVKRQIILHHGQALFTVAKDMRRPFEVELDDIRVQALGTVFEVDRHDERETRVSVLEHAVKVNLLNNQASENNFTGVEIGEKQRLRYRHDGVFSDTESFEPEQASSWQHRRLFMNDRPLEELVNELNRYRMGRVFVSDKEVGNLRISGVFSLDNTDDTIRSVCDVLGLRETRLSSWWVLLHR